ncbi:MAG: pantoate--beta-alanine ligase [Planctomycetota bacterium]|nr:pantoate--beta-alanine ligase [Planctomycetota bacterium]
MANRRLESPAEAEDWCRAATADGRTLGFVPTMGALHEGHLSLVRRAVAENDAACVSVFVNPLQFDQPEDLARYPRNMDADAVVLDGVDCSMVFTGTLQQFFPFPADANAIALRDPGAAARGLEGDCRPGHFEGVATIVARLFEIVQPTRAYFGEKDFQQLMVVRGLARELDGPDVVACPTVREPDGLALSSRNARLDPESRGHALALSRALHAARAAWREGVRRADRLAAVMREELASDSTGSRGAIEVEYAEVRDPERWTPEAPTGELVRARALVAARVGGVRLIDNLELEE